MRIMTKETFFKFTNYVCSFNWVDEQPFSCSKTSKINETMKPEAKVQKVRVLLLLLQKKESVGERGIKNPSTSFVDF